MRIHPVAMALVSVGAWTALACGERGDASMRADEAPGSGASAGASAGDRLDGGASPRLTKDRANSAGASSTATGSGTGRGGEAPGQEPLGGSGGAPGTGGIATGGSGNLATGGAPTGGASSGGAASGGTTTASGGSASATGGAGGATVSTGGLPPLPIAGAAGGGAAEASGGVSVGGASGAATGGAAPTLEQPLVITEIMFNPRSSPELEWVELCNRTSQPLDLTAYTFWDDDNDASVAPNFPDATVVPGESCVVLTGVDDVAAFQEAWGEEVPVVGLEVFPVLTNSGDRVQLWDADHPPEPESVDPATDTLIAFDYPGSMGDGAASIQLVDSAADPSESESWELSGDDPATTVTTDGDVGTPGIAP
jgi:hypothetical protein